MKKDGFTLIELMISIMLVGIVMISMIGTLLSLKDTYTNMNEHVEARVYSSLITKVINEHFNKNKGVKSVTCDTNTHCDIVLGNDKNMELEILTATAKSTTSTDSSGGRVVTNEETTTLKYSGDNYSYYKTIKHYKRKYLTNNNEIETGYKFIGLESHQYEYTNVSDSSLKDTITNITVKMSDPKYNIELYASTTVNSSGEGRKVITANAGSIDTIPATTGWVVSSDRHTAIKRVAPSQVVGTLPTLSKTNYTFVGWSSDMQGNNIINSNSVVTANMTIYPIWSLNSNPSPNCYWSTNAGSEELILICPGDIM